MNAKKMIAAVAVFAATGSAFADNAFADTGHNFKPGKTRAEVQAELQQAQASGTYVVGGHEFIAPDTASTRTRAAVFAELKQAQDEGIHVVGGREFETPETGPASTRIASGKSRAQVYAELVQAQEDGIYVVGGQEFAGQFPAATRNAAAIARHGKAGNGTGSN